MANIMNPVFTGTGVDRSAPPARTTQTSGDDFSEHLDRKVQESRSSRDDKVGMKHREVESRRRDEPPPEAAQERSESSEQDRENSSVSDLLAMYLHDLQQMSQDNDLGVGEWVVPGDSLDLLQGLAENAGMDEIDFSALLAQSENEDGNIDLASFFSSLETYFDEFDADPAVLVPETEFPLLESLLAQMGMSEEQLGQISDMAVTEDGKLDLGKLNDALSQMQGEFSDTGSDVMKRVLGEFTEVSETSLQPINLTEAEAELLQGTLAQAGLNLGDQLELLPEQLFSKDVVLSYDRLQSMLDKTVNVAKDEFSNVDLLAFLDDLEGVMNKAQFADTSVGISPLVQNSMVDVYNDLIGIFDDVQNRFKEGMAFDEMVSVKDAAKWRAGVVDRLAQITGMDPKDINVQSGLSPDVSVGGATASPTTTPLFSGAGVTPEQMGSFSSPPSEQFLSVEQQSVQNARAEIPQSARHFSVQQQQQIMNQLSLAVARGAKTGEHHLTLRLHPAELGDVKVDLVMKGGEISAHFNIANSKVKETMESSMDEFRQEMEQKGFNLGALQVSVGGQDDPGEAWQRFEMAWTGEQLQAETLEDLPRESLYHVGHGQQYVTEKSVNLFV